MHNDNNDKQLEYLLQPHQAQAHSVGIDDCAKRYTKVDGTSGGQCVWVVDKIFPLYFDGWKCFFAISLPTHDDLSKYPHYELTSPHPYEPAKRLHTPSRKSKPTSVLLFKEWQARLGYPPLEVVQHTLASTTQMVKTVEAESCTYMCDHLKARLLPLQPQRQEFIGMLITDEDGDYY